MSLIKYIVRLQRMDSLIAMKATGPPEEFAYKMNLSRSTLFDTLQEMKGMRLHLVFSNKRSNSRFQKIKNVLKRKIVANGHSYNIPIS